jgi:uncharacterized repeat protein (TIGR03803 family)
MIKFNWAMRACGVFLLWATMAVALSAQTLTTVHGFKFTDGADPAEPLVQGTDGNLYGTTSHGGDNVCTVRKRNYGCGTVFKINTSGKLTTLYSFCAQTNCADGEQPAAGLVEGNDGNFYGTTPAAGANITGGTVFKITPNGTLTTLHSFCAQVNCQDGASPYGVLIQATDGNFYGTTVSGGTHGDGTVFKITPSGMLTTLYNFCSQGGESCTDGYFPQAGVVQATNENFYGTTNEGGVNGHGTVFKITKSGILTTLYSFCAQSGCVDGEYPTAGLVQATNGDLYGTTSEGGINNYGTVFKITKSGTLTTLHSFDYTDGDLPDGGLVQGTDGNLYGTTGDGGTGNYGTIFKITPSGTLTTLYNFCLQGGGCKDGEGPAGLVQDTDGNFYGTTGNGGARKDGTVYSLSVGLGPFVETRPTSGKVGAAVTILGTSLTGSTSVTFNGTAATFTVVSASEITTTVPADATTGTVKVVTPGGTLSSNVPFTVKP